MMPSPQSITISYVIDGKLVERESAPRRMLSAIITRLKILAKLDITLKDQPQSGIVRLTVGDQSFDGWVHLGPCSEGTTALIELDRTLAVEPEAVQDWRSNFLNTSPVSTERS